MTDDLMMEQRTARACCNATLALATTHNTLHSQRCFIWSELVAGLPKDLVKTPAFNTRSGSNKHAININWNSYVCLCLGRSFSLSPLLPFPLPGPQFQLVMQAVQVPVDILQNTSSAVNAWLSQWLMASLKATNPTKPASYLHQAPSVHLSSSVWGAGDSGCRYESLYAACHAHGVQASHGTAGHISTNDSYTTHWPLRASRIPFTAH